MSNIKNNSVAGEKIRELLAKQNISINDLSAKMCMPVVKINALLNGECEISYCVALKLEVALGVPARYWLNLK